MRITGLKQPRSKRPVLYYEAVWLGAPIDEDRSKRVLKERYKFEPNIKIKAVS